MSVSQSPPTDENKPNDRGHIMNGRIRDGYRECSLCFAHENEKAIVADCNGKPERQPNRPNPCPHCNVSTSLYAPIIREPMPCGCYVEDCKHCRNQLRVVAGKHCEMAGDYRKGVGNRVG